MIVCLNEVTEVTVMLSQILYRSTLLLNGGKTMFSDLVLK